MYCDRLSQFAVTGCGGRDRFSGPNGPQHPRVRATSPRLATALLGDFRVSARSTRSGVAPGDRPRGAYERREMRQPRGLTRALRGRRGLRAAERPLQAGSVCPPDGCGGRASSSSLSSVRRWHKQPISPPWSSGWAYEVWWHVVCLVSRPNPNLRGLCALIVCGYGVRRPHRVLEIRAIFGW
jgi:hypothetical protein